MASEDDKIAIKQLIDTDQLRKDMAYSLADLSTAMQDQSALFVHYGVLVAKASRQVDDLKMVLEATEAAVYRKLREDALKTAEKVTEAQLDKGIIAHPKVVALKRALNEAKQIEATAKTAAEGFRHRRDMLIQAGMLAREEMKGEVSISRRTEVEEDRKALQDRVMRRLTENAAS